jgi:hypothetical protein
MPGAEAAAPIEWVPGARYWWFYRFVPWVALAAVVVEFVAVEYYLTGAPGLYSDYYWLATGIVLGGVALAIVVPSRFPSVRRIGISPEWFIVDDGLQTHTFGWPDVREVERTRLGHYGWNQHRFEDRTRIHLGYGVPRKVVMLTSYQGDRLARFLHLP